MKLVVHETNGVWAAALRREVSPRVTIVETRNFDELRQQLSQSPTGVVLMEIAESRVEPSIAAITQAAGQFPDAAIVAVADRKLSRYELLLREAGAVHVVFSPRQVAEITAIVKRRLAVQPENDFNAEETSLEEQILAKLPWA